MNASSSSAAAVEQGRGGKGPFSVLWRLAALMAATAAAIGALALFVPEENDYAKATLLKHHRLATTSGHRIILVGGSNLSYGVDSRMIEQGTGCATVNMGVNGFFGARYLLQEIKRDVRPGDVVVVAFEWDSFVKSIDGSGVDHFVLAKNNPAAIADLTWRQRWSAVQAIPFVAQQKALRLINQAYWIVMGPPPPPEVDIWDVESLKSFSPLGDLEGHLGLTWPWYPDDGLDLTALGLDPHIVPLMKDFSKEMEARGVRTIVSYTPTLQSYYNKHTAFIENAHRQLADGADGLLAPSPPSAFVYEARSFFDTAYHLNRIGRPVRTRRIIEDLHGALGPRGTCKVSS